MFITGLGEVRGIGSMTKMCVNGTMMRMRDLDDQSLSLLVPAILNSDPVTYAVPGSDNRPLRKKLLRLNPNLRPNLRG